MKKCCKTETKKERKMEKVEEERKKENCMVCEVALEYLTEAVGVVCNYCGKEETGYIRCPKGHYVCEICHGKGAFEVVKDLALSTTLKDPIAIAETMMAHPNIPMLGCEHAYITAAAFLASIKNQGTLRITDDQIVESMQRARDISKSGYCGLAGTCGIASGLAAAFSVILGAVCAKDVEMSIVLHIMARATEAIANDAGPCCCKSFVRTTLGVGYNAAKEYLKINLPIHRERISCFYVKRHPHGCRATKCNYFPKR